MNESDTLQKGGPRKPLGERMKQYEAATELQLDPSRPAVLRLDGHAFSTFTAPFAKPFDERLHTAMVKTCADLLQAYPAATLAYTQSDEVTLLFPSGVGSFNGRVMKVATLAAGLCSVHFYAHLLAAMAEMPEPAVKNFEVLPLPHFDGRLFSVPSEEECLNNVIWRCRVDAVRNSVSAFARSLFSTRELHGKNKDDMLAMARDKGVVYTEAVPKWALEGTLVKKKLVDVEAVDVRTGEAVAAVRTRMGYEDTGMTEFSEDNLALVTSNYWPEGQGHDMS